MAQRDKSAGRMAILYPGDREARDNAAPEKSRFLKVFQALEQLGLQAESCVYNDDFCDEVRRQLMQVDVAQRASLSVPTPISS